MDMVTALRLHRRRGLERPGAFEEFPREVVHRGQADTVTRGGECRAEVVPMVDGLEADEFA